jgi:hypothetical protein
MDKINEDIRITITELADLRQKYQAAIQDLETFFQQQNNRDRNPTNRICQITIDNTR